MHKTLSICLGVVILYIIMKCQASQFGRYMGGYHIYMYIIIYIYVHTHTYNQYTCCISINIYLHMWMNFPSIRCPFIYVAFDPRFDPTHDASAPRGWEQTERHPASPVATPQDRRTWRRAASSRRDLREMIWGWVKTIQNLYIVTDMGGRNNNFHQWFIRVASRCHRVLTHSHFWIGFKGKSKGQLYDCGSINYGFLQILQQTNPYHPTHFVWLGVDLPLWKMMEFVSWDYYSQYMEK